MTKLDYATSLIGVFVAGIACMMMVTAAQRSSEFDACIREYRVQNCKQVFVPRDFELRRR